jgi:hypothetical protein
MFLETVQFLIKTIADLFVLVLLLRFYLQVAGRRSSTPCASLSWRQPTLPCAAAQAGAIHSWLRQRHCNVANSLTLSHKLLHCRVQRCNSRKNQAV